MFPVVGAPRVYGCSGRTVDVLDVDLLASDVFRFAAVSSYFLPPPGWALYGFLSRSIGRGAVVTSSSSSRDFVSLSCELDLDADTEAGTRSMVVGCVLGGGEISLGLFFRRGDFDRSAGGLRGSSTSQ